MAIKSTGISIKSSHRLAVLSGAGVSKQTMHSESPVKHASAPMGNPGRIATKAELEYCPKSKDVTTGQNGVKMGSFKPHNARSTASGIFPKHIPTIGL